jgi:hypothetical protein
MKGDTYENEMHNRFRRICFETDNSIISKLWSKLRKEEDSLAKKCKSELALMS